MFTCIYTYTVLFTYIGIHMIYARYIYLYAYMHIYVCYVLLTYIRIHMDICTYGVYIIDTKSIK